MEFFLEMLLTAVVALLFSFLVAKLVSAASGGGGDDPIFDQAEIGVGGDGFDRGELLYIMKLMDAEVIESERNFRVVVDENVELVDRFVSEGDRVDEVEEAATGNAKIRADREEAESTADNVVAEEVIVREQDKQSNSAEEIGVEREDLMVETTTPCISPEETLSQGTEKISACVENEESGDVIGAESEEVKVEESSNTVEESYSEEKNEEDDDWEGIERSELEKAFVAASNILDESGKVGEISADVKMELYGLHKIATEGPCREAQPMAIMASARAKWNAWQKLGNMNQEEAMEQYLTLISKEIPGLVKMPELETSVVLPPNSGTTLDTTGVDSSKMGKGESSV